MVDFAVSLDEAQGTGGVSWRLRLARLLKRHVAAAVNDLPGFDPETYLRTNPDLPASGLSPLWHYSTIGWIEGRDIAPGIDTRSYLASHPKARRLLLDIYASRAAKAGRPFHGAPRRRPPREPGVLVIGHVEANLGLGESTRGLVRALAGTEVPFAVYPYTYEVEDRFVGPFMPERYDRSTPYAVTVFEANGDQVPGFFEQFGHRLEGSHTIFRTYWELAEAPQSWAQHLARFDEIWAPTAFVAEAFRRVFDGRITLVPPCVSVEIGQTFPRAHFGLDADRFLFVLTFDYSSIAARKNPLGLIEAFQRAFPDEADRVGLVLKASGPAHLSPDIRAAVAQAAERDTRIVVIDKTLSRDEILSLVQACDCYVSLHRSEGFGFGMAEAMALGRPVIGTDYSGNRDFLDAATGWPVPYRLTALADDAYPHGDGHAWAEPDLDAAAEIMREVHRDVAGRDTRVAAGRRLIEDRFGEAAIGRAASERLSALLRSR